mgnify:CR=1 FL=1|tara:strand:+ start:2627 stop:3223 length:597 start_codon:yes stop_codon:yes gene_type:complete
MNSIIKYLTTAIVALAISACTPTKVDITEGGMSTGQPPADPHAWVTWETCGQRVGDHPCNFSLVDQHGKNIELYDYHGKVIVIDFSTMWCGVCVQIATKGDELVAEHGADNVIWLTVLIENATGNPPTGEDLSQWADTFGITVPVLAGDRSMIDYSATTGYPIAAWPTLVIIDREMVLQHGISGWSDAAISAWVSGLL